MKKGLKVVVLTPKRRRALFLLIILICLTLVAFLWMNNRVLQKSNQFLRKQIISKNVKLNELREEADIANKKSAYKYLPITKKINDIEYSLFTDPESGMAPRFQVNGQDATGSTINQFIPFISRNTVDFWIDTSVQKFYLTEEMGYDFQLFFLIDYNENEPGHYQIDQVTVLSTENLPIYSRAHILDYYSDSETLLMYSHGGDSCSTWGEIWTINSIGNRRSLAEISGGCSTNELRFGGMVEGKPIFAAVSAREVETFSGQAYATINTLFTIDPQSGVRSYIESDELAGKYDLLSNIQYQGTVPTADNSNRLLLQGIGTEEYFYYDTQTGEFTSTEPF